MEEKLRQLAFLIEEAEKERLFDLSDPVEVYQWDIHWNLIHEKFSNFEERFLRGALLLLEEENFE